MANHNEIKRILVLSDLYKQDSNIDRIISEHAKVENNINLFDKTLATTTIQNLSKLKALSEFQFLDEVSLIERVNSFDKAAALTELKTNKQAVLSGIKNTINEIKTQRKGSLQSGDLLMIDSMVAKINFELNKQGV